VLLQAAQLLGHETQLFKTCIVNSEQIQTPFDKIKPDEQEGLQRRVNELYMKPVEQLKHIEELKEEQ